VPRRLPASYNHQIWLHVYPSPDTCIPVLRPVPTARPYGHDDYDGDVHRLFISGLENNPIVSTAELFWQTGDFREVPARHSIFAPLSTNVRVPSHFTSGAHCRPPLSPICLSPDSQRACVLVTSLPPSAVPPRFPLHSLARPPSHWPSSCTPRSRPVPCAPLALVIILPLLRVLCPRCGPEALKRRHR
jgi:hypothetical protein